MMMKEIEDFKAKLEAMFGSESKKQSLDEAERNESFHLEANFHSFSSQALTNAPCKKK